MPGEDEWRSQGPGQPPAQSRPADTGGAPTDHGDHGYRPYTHDPYRTPPQTYPPSGHATGQPTEARTNVFAVIALVASILGLIAVLPFLGSVIGIVLAVIARKEIAADPTQGGKGLADWGLILGIVGLVFWFLMGILMLMMAAMFGAFWGPWWM